MTTSNNLLILILLLLGPVLQAQVVDSTNYNKWEFGLDAAKLNPLMPKQIRILEKSQFTLYYFRYDSETRLKRISLSADIDGFLSRPAETEITFIDNNWIVNLAVANLRVYDTRWKFLKVLGGWDTQVFFRAFQDYGLSGELGGDSKSNNYSLKLGYGPDLGLKFSINDNLGIYIHANFHFNIGYSRVVNEISNNPKIVSDRFTYSISEYIPRTLILMFNF